MGGMAEWFIVLVLKTRIAFKTIKGSNPSYELSSITKFE
jgi:hypothetical protein